MNAEALRRLAGGVLALSTLLTSMADGAYSERDVHYLARAIEGEGAELFSNRAEVGLWIGHVAMNRREQAWWPAEMVNVITSAFHGYVNVTEPAGWAVALARECLERGEGGDVAEGALFVLSRQDLEKYGWPAEGAVRSFEEGVWGLYFFREWPGRGR